MTLYRTLTNMLLLLVSMLGLGVDGACEDYPDCSSCASEKGCAFVFGRTMDKCIHVEENQCNRGLLSCTNPEDTTTCKDPDNKFCANVGESGENGARFQLGSCKWLKDMKRQSKKHCQKQETCSQCQGISPGIKVNNVMDVQRFAYYGCGWFNGKCSSQREGWPCDQNNATDTCPRKCPGSMFCSLLFMY